MTGARVRSRINPSPRAHIGQLSVYSTRLQGADGVPGNDRGTGFDYFLAAQCSYHTILISVDFLLFEICAL